MSVATLTESRVYGRDLEYARDQVLPGITDVAIDSQPVTNIFLGQLASQFAERGSGGTGKRTYGGGASIEHKLRLGVNTTRKELGSAYATFDLTPSDTVRHIRLNWTLYSAAVNISEHELDMASGEMAKANMIEEEMESGMRALVDLVGTHLYSNSDVAGRVGDLASAISANDALGGINGNANAGWNSRGVSARGTAAASISFAGGSFATTGLSNWRIAFNNASEGATARPQAMLTTHTIEEFYEGKLQAQERFTMGGTADGGFSFLAFKNVPVIPDPKCTSGLTWFLNLDTLHLGVLAGADFNSTPFAQPDSQRVRVSKLFATMQLVCTDRRLQNKITGQTA